MHISLVNMSQNQKSGNVSLLDLIKKIEQILGGD